MALHNEQTYTLEVVIQIWESVTLWNTLEVKVYSHIGKKENEFAILWYIQRGPMLGKGMLQGGVGWSGAMTLT